MSARMAYYRCVAHETDLRDFSAHTPGACRWVTKASLKPRYHTVETFKWMLRGFRSPRVL